MVSSGALPVTTATERYDLVVIGAGAAGLSAAGFAGKLDKRVALIEKHALGGDCTWFGCVPSKALLKVGQVAHTIRSAGEYGLQAIEPIVDMGAVRDYIQAAIQDVYAGETPEVFAREYGVDVIQGEAQFVDAHTVQVGQRLLTAKWLVIATGARPTIPPVPGLNEVDYKTNETLFENDRLPNHLMVMGGGPIGVEIAQAYRRLGAAVTIIDETLLRRDEPEAQQIVRDVFADEGIHIADTLVQSVEQSGQAITACLQNGETVTGDMLVVAVGRTPNVQRLNLAASGVAFTDAGIPVDKYLRTNVPHIYAVGDCTTGPKFTHYAGQQGITAGMNVTLPLINSKGVDDRVPWVTFIDPEVAHVGLTEAQARERYGKAVKVFILPMSESDRGRAENNTRGFIKLVYKGLGTLLGATIVAERAGEMIVELELVLKTGLRLTALTNVFHIYPTYSETVRKAIGLMLMEDLLSRRPIRWGKKLLNFV